MLNFQDKHKKAVVQKQKVVKDNPVNVKMGNDKFKPLPLLKIPSKYKNEEVYAIRYEGKYTQDEIAKFTYQFSKLLQRKSPESYVHVVLKILQKENGESVQKHFAGMKWTKAGEQPFVWNA